jgi:hypothetical protein
VYSPLSPGGYTLDVAAEQVDLGRFDRLAADGRAADGPSELRS